MNLLPPNATKTEKHLCDVTTSQFNTPFPLSLLIQPQACPTSLLPFLAWHVCVDNWDNSFTEKQKRDAIASSIEVHKRKGTRGAMNTALQSLGFDIEFKEWFEHTPKLAPFTFSVKINAKTQFKEQELKLLQKTINTTKNARSHLTSMTVFSTSSATESSACTLLNGSTTQLSPYQPCCITSSGLSYSACALRVISRTKIKRGYL